MHYLLKKPKLYRQCNLCFVTHRPTECPGPQPIEEPKQQRWCPGCFLSHMPATCAVHAHDVLQAQNAKALSDKGEPMLGTKAEDYAQVTPPPMQGHYLTPEELRSYGGELVDAIRSGSEHESVESGSWVSQFYGAEHRGNERGVIRDSYGRYIGWAGGQKPKPQKVIRAHKWTVEGQFHGKKGERRTIPLTSEHLCRVDSWMIYGSGVIHGAVVGGRPQRYLSGPFDTCQPGQQIEFDVEFTDDGLIRLKLDGKCVKD